MEFVDLAPLRAAVRLPFSVEQLWRDIIQQTVHFANTLLRDIQIRQRKACCRINFLSIQYHGHAVQSLCLFRVSLPLIPAPQAADQTAERIAGPHSSWWIGVQVS